MHPDFRRYSDEQVDAAVLLALEEVDLPESYRISIRALVRSRAMNWRTCCGGTCNPCIGRIEEAVDRARKLLLEGQPESAELKTRDSAPAPVPQASTPSRSISKDSASTQDADEESEDDRNWGLNYH